MTVIYLHIIWLRFGTVTGLEDALFSGVESSATLICASVVEGMRYDALPAACDRFSSFCPVPARRTKSNH